MTKDYQEKWGVEEAHLAIKMLQEGALLREISDRLGRTYEGVRKFFKRRGLRQTRALTAIRVEARKRLELRTTHIAKPKPASKTVPPHLIAEREARLNEPRTLSMELCGDPPFSQSALYKKLGSGGPPPEPSAPAVTSPTAGATIQRDA